MKYRCPSCLSASMAWLVSARNKKSSAERLMGTYTSLGDAIMLPSGRCRDRYVLRRDLPVSKSNKTSSMSGEPGRLSAPMACASSMRSSVLGSGTREIPRWSTRRIAYGSTLAAASLSTSCPSLDWSESKKKTTSRPFSFAVWDFLTSKRMPLGASRAAWWNSSLSTPYTPMAPLARGRISSSTPSPSTSAVTMLNVSKESESCAILPSSDQDELATSGKGPRLRPSQPWSGCPSNLSIRCSPLSPCERTRAYSTAAGVLPCQSTIGLPSISSSPFLPAFCLPGTTLPRR